MLKGGLVLELRLERARATKDVDLRLVGASDTVLARLQQAGRLDLGDFMTFELGHDTDHPTILNEGMQYEGQRFRAECRLAGKLYGQRFGVDVAFGDPVFGEADSVTADDVLDFAGIAPPVLRLYPVETHIAEKLHAYTIPRPRSNTRVKDLPDIALLATTQPLRAERLRQALEQTFIHRATHPLPTALPDPPTNWSTPYLQMVRENELVWTTLELLTTAVAAFLNPCWSGVPVFGILPDGAGNDWNTAQCAGRGSRMSPLLQGKGTRLNPIVLLGAGFSRNWGGWQIPGMALQVDSLQPLQPRATARWIPTGQIHPAQRMQPLYKLHGSSNWRDGANGSLLIMGGEKAREIQSHEILGRYAHEFQSQLSTPHTRLMVIGYGFRDPHINAVITAAVEGGLKFFLIDPAGSGLARSLNPTRQPGMIQVGTPLETVFETGLIGASRRSLPEIFGSDAVEHDKVLRFFEP